MDHQTFDRLARVFAASGSRRAAWRALLGAALLGATTRAAMATSSTPVSPTGQRGTALLGNKCCPGRVLCAE